MRTAPNGEQVDKRRILVVDDDPYNRQILRVVLTTEGFEVSFAHDSAECMREVQRQRPELVLMDVRLPGKDGIVLARELRADPAFATIPIVAITANAMVGDAERTLLAGFDGYISKPINTRTLGNEVAAFLGYDRAPD